MLCQCQKRIYCMKKVAVLLTDFVAINKNGERMHFMEKTCACGKSLFVFVPQSETQQRIYRGFRFSTLMSYSLASRYRGMF